MGDALSALRPQRLRTKAASSLLPHWLDGYSECNSCSSRVLLAHVESANCPVAYQGLKITTSLSSVSMIFSVGMVEILLRKKHLALTLIYRLVSVHNTAEDMGAVLLKAVYVFLTKKPTTSEFKLARPSRP
ncbi:hypothetical protein [Bathymodiolus japonicus methanotrophic gill symbiont]|uniref:hypothetical protein n=1 Tax=Bathymodiolus japonicus methanotrophic gill symbiont TaxID=113269 RepID=UPI001C8E5B34|nr:hypothetical protein [Bathymodiolus japonicus methanotrophic gill symbiont]